MRLTGLELYPIRAARDTGVVNEHILVRLEASDGCTGWGEMSDLSHLPMYQVDVTGLERSLREVLLGTDADNVNQIERRLIGFFPDEGHMYSRSGLVRQGIDLALHDLLARAQGVPVHCLLGGALRDRLPMCFPIFRLRSQDQLEPTLARVEAKLGEGFSIFRIYVGASPELDLELVQAFADRFGDRARIKSLDFSNLLPWRRALPLAERLTGICQTMLVESVAPRGDIDGTIEFRRRSQWPVSEHAHGIRHAWELLHRGAVDVLNLSPYVLGGIRATLRVASVAEAAGADILLGTTQELSLGTAAVAHVGSVLPALPYPGDNVGPRLYTSDVVADELDYDGGELLVPDAPGLGPRVDPDKLEGMRSNGTWSFGVDLAGAVDRTASAR